VREFHSLSARAVDALADRPEFRLTPWPDPVIDRLGYDPRHPYCEKFWTPIVGPTVYLLGRRFVDWLDEHPDGLGVAPVPLAGALGLGNGVGRHSPLLRSLARLVGFELAAVHPSGAGLSVRQHWPPLPARRAARLPGWLAEEHRAEIETHAPTRLAVRRPEPAA